MFVSTHWWMIVRPLGFDRYHHTDTDTNMDSVDHTDTDMESVDHNDTDTDTDTDTERKDSFLTDTDTRCFI